MPIIAILLLAFTLRLWGISDHSIWWDEGRSASMARFSTTEIIQQLADGNHPPLHYIVLHGWWLLVGDGEYVMRFSSVLFGLLWIALTYRLGLIVGHRGTAQMGALLLSISRFSIVWSQQVRMYTWSTIWTTLVIFTALSFWRRKHWQSLVLYVASAAAAILSLYLTVSAMITINLVFIYVWYITGKSLRLFIHWMIAQLGVVAIVLPWIILNASQAETWAILEPITLVEYLRLYASMLVVGNPIDISKTLPFTLSAVCVFLFGLTILVKQHRQIRQRIGLITLCLGLLTQAVVVYAVCFGIIPGFARPLVPRYLLLMSSGFYLVAGWGITSLADVSFLKKRRCLVFFAGALFITPQLIGLSTLYPGRVKRDDYVSIANTLRALRYPEDALILYVDRDWPVFEAHYAELRSNVPYGMDINEDSVEAFLSPLWLANDAIWLVTTPEALESDPTQLIPAWLAERSIGSYIIIDTENQLSLYVRTPERQGSVFYLAPGTLPVGTSPESRDLHNILIPLKKYRTGDTIHLAFIWTNQYHGQYELQIIGRTYRKQQLVEPHIYEQNHGYVYQLVDIYLDPRMPGGRYRINVVDNNGNTVADKRFELIHAAAGLDIALTQVPNPVSYTLGESIHLIGYTLAESEVRAGDFVGLTLYWRADSPVSSRYKVFTHVLGENYNANTGNFIWGQIDNEPGRGQALTTLWNLNSVIIDPYEIGIDTQAPPGNYVIEVGMYGLVDAARLPVFSAEGRVKDDAIQLISLEVLPP